MMNSIDHATDANDPQSKSQLDDNRFIDINIDSECESSNVAHKAQTKLDENNNLANENKKNLFNFRKKSPSPRPIPSLNQEPIKTCQ